MVGFGLWHDRPRDVGGVPGYFVLVLKFVTSTAGYRVSQTKAHAAERAKLSPVAASRCQTSNPPHLSRRAPVFDSVVLRSSNRLRDAAAPPEAAPPCRSTFPRRRRPSSRDGARSRPSSGRCAVRPSRRPAPPCARARVRADLGTRSSCLRGDPTTPSTTARPSRLASPTTATFSLRPSRTSSRGTGP